MGKETTDSESKTAMLSTPNLSPGVFEKQGNSEVWKLNQEVNWDELIQGIVVPGRDRTEHEPENGRYGGNKDKIKTDVVNPEQEFPKSINVFHTTKKEKRILCKLCQNRKLDTIFLPCGHLVFCNLCCASQNIKLCPQCFKEIEHVNEAQYK
ncbi:MYLIP [Mytilus coruscus]|uniref:MYLIP n=1 Tax=Mytilus coruscus TaxID=42192 RepID=A0A6J8D7T2_MYTCO|nr:MYLIP [Mytilus coruscus]